MTRMSRWLKVLLFHKSQYFIVLYVAKLSQGTGYLRKRGCRPFAPERVSNPRCFESCLGYFSGHGFTYILAQLLRDFESFFSALPVVPPVLSSLCSTLRRSTVYSTVVRVHTVCSNGFNEILQFEKKTRTSIEWSASLRVLTSAAESSRRR
jgi:hypothetical protein